MGTPGASAMSDPPFSRCRDPPGTHLGVSMTITRNKDISPVLPVYITVMIPSVIGRRSERIALADEKCPLGFVAGPLNRRGISGCRLGDPAEAAQQVGAGGVVQVV